MYIDWQSNEKPGEGQYKHKYIVIVCFAQLSFATNDGFIVLSGGWICVDMVTWHMICKYTK